MHFPFVKALAAKITFKAKLSIRTLKGGASFDLFFFSFSPQAHFSRLSGTAAISGIVTLCYVTVHSIEGFSPEPFMLFLCFSVIDEVLW